HETVGAPRHDRHLRDGERRGVGGEDRGGRAEPVQDLVDLALGLEVLHHRLDDDVGGRELVERRGSLEPAEDLRLLLGRDLALLDALGEERLDPPEALPQEVVAHLAHHDLVSRLGTDLGDPGAHEPAANDPDSLDGHVVRVRQSSLRMTMAMPWPPPMQAVARPCRARRRRSSSAKVRSSRVPVAPRGWPRAMAPPLTFVRSRSRPSSFSTARYWPAKASLTSTRSMSLTESPADSR